MEFEITIDDAHLEEHYEEWVAVLGPRTRWMGRISISLIVLGGAICLSRMIADWPGEKPGRYGLFALLYGIYLRFSLARTRRAWLRAARARSNYGTTHLLFVYDGVLVSGPPEEVDKNDVVALDLLTTPRGYFVRFGGDKGSLYLPHRLLEPPTSREAFLAAVRPEPDVKRRGSA